MQYFQHGDSDSSSESTELIDSPYITYNENVYEDIPFLSDYTLGDLMILKNIEFQIASKCYRWKQQLRHAPLWFNAEMIMDPQRWVPEQDRTFYSNIVYIKAVMEFIRSSDIDMLQWMYQVKRNVRGPFFWLYNIEEMIAKQSRTFTAFAMNWKFTLTATIATQERKRIKHFQWLLKEKFAQYNLYEPVIFFNILRYIFVFAQTNRNPFFFPSPKRKLDNLFCLEQWSDDESSVKELKIIN